MNDDTEDPTVLRDYLLGTLKDEIVRSRIEMRLMTDDKFADELAAAENGLIEEYLEGSLNREESDHFATHFLASPERKRQLRLTQNLRKYSAQAGTAPQARRSFFDLSPIFANSWLRFAAIALVLIVAGLGIWRFAIYQSDTAKSLAQLRLAYKGQRPLEPRITALPDYVPYSETRGPAPNVADPDALHRAEVLIVDSTQNPNNAKAHQTQALIYLAQKKCDDAKREFDTALKAAPNDASLQSDAGAAYLQMAKNTDGEKEGAKYFEFLDESLKHLEAAISLAPKMPEPRFNKALALEALFTPEQAKAAWNEYLSIDPNSKWADEARFHMQKLEANPLRERSAEELESDFLAAFRRNDEEEAGRLIAENRELIRDKYLPTRLAMSYLSAADKNRQELLHALEFAGQLERKNTGDAFASEIANYYSRVSSERRDLLSRAQAGIRAGFQDCLLGGNYQAAIDDFSRARDAFIQSDDPREAALANYYVAYSLMNIENVADSLGLLEKIAAEARFGGYSWLEATVDYWIGIGLVKSGKHAMAKREYERAFSIAEKIDDGYIAQRNLLEMADLAALGKQNNKALIYIAKILQFCGRPNASVRQRFRSLSDVSILLSNLRLDNVAIIVGIDAVSTAANAGDRVYEALTQANAAIVNTRLHRYGDAFSLLSKCQNSAQLIGDEKTRSKTLAYCDLRIGDLQRESNNFEQADISYSRARDYYVGAAMPFRLAEAEKGLLQTAIARHDIDEVTDRIDSNIEITEKYRDQIEDEQEKIGFFDESDGIYDLATGFEFDRENSEAAYNYAERSSARSLLDAQMRGGPAAVGLSDNLVALSQGNRLLNLRQLQVRIPPEVQILQYSVLEDRTLIWVVAPDTFAVKSIPVGTQALRDKVDEFRRLLLSKGVNDRDSRNRQASELYDLLIAPIHGDLDRNRHICIIPNKVLYSLPFAALASSDGKPLISEIEFFYSPSANILVNCSDSASNRADSARIEKLLAIGNPSFAKAEFAELSDLPQAEREVESIAQFYLQPKVLVRGNATKSAVLTALPLADIVHFAGHYVAVGEAPMESHLVLAGSGIALGQNVLTNAELRKMNLPRARLIVIAACQSSVESYFDAEGSIGLSHTLLATGVPLVIASVWQIDSEATGEIMKRFHELRVNQHYSTTEALRQAQLSLFNDSTGRYSDPYYWAGFTAVGGFAKY